MALRIEGPDLDLRIREQAVDRIHAMLFGRSEHQFGSGLGENARHSLSFIGYKYPEKFYREAASNRLPPSGTGVALKSPRENLGAKLLWGTPCVRINIGSCRKFM